ncbi:MAG: 2,3,4,5-tetrahydropyridine-2,6-dicarboxylate N-succinyltransferase [Candidatus Eremiobacteraeota bacterium]|nr:2,3,4,5-tetrahydropyridine-2,6-dicarboxylate N-succinyltransferase [Candidatus Eremiobacteraeota bacterium]MBC5827835.1 2,3,4,5-tetrahydropyridine-2,6-dicarboxylate N-succinyltransferase [Candidatus Eremiobacteraeota bacterium]
MSADVPGLISAAFTDREKLAQPATRSAVEQTIAALDTGALRVAEPQAGSWSVREWVKQAILLYFVLRESSALEAGGLHFYDKIPLKTDWERSGVRVVPPATARFGSYVAPGAILMPSFVNIGAYVGAGTMVDTWATVGSCAQIGEGVHISGGVGIGGVLEPPGARPVIVEDGAFIGSRCVIVEGIVVEREAVLGAGVVLTSSTPIIDATTQPPVQHKGSVPARSVVIPATQPKDFPAGTFGTPCALIIGRRSDSTDRKTSLNTALRSYGIAV